MKLIFLDIDGVLNAPHKTGSTRLLHECILPLNRIVKETGAKIVLSSTWRMYIHGGSMTCGGFAMLLHSHGGCGLEVIGATTPYRDCPDCGRVETTQHVLEGEVCKVCKARVTRGGQISEWLRSFGAVESYVAIDDDDDITAAGHPLVQTNARVGLTESDADRAIAILNKPSEAASIVATLPHGKDKA